MSTTAIFQKHTLVTLTKGRFAGKRGVVLEADNDRVIVCGVSKLHFESENGEKKKKFFRTKKFSEVFIKKMNPMHLIPMDKKVNLEIQLNTATVFSDKNEKNKARETLKKIFKNNLENQSAKWIYEKVKIFRDDLKA